MRAWLLALAACGAATTPPPVAPKSLEINQGGTMVDVTAALVPGSVTVIDFWSESCGACTTVAGMLAVQTASEPRVVVRKVDVGDGFTPVAKAYDIGALPHFKIYDRKKRLRYVLVGGDCLRAPALARQLLAEP
ncbi:MAG: thioredoxin family protein [Deltaproteobacteria bacterium]|nr:thioredoxin family protein [Deltaproteobacteria bacterium]